jgi:hypothetical protein
MNFSLSYSALNIGAQKMGLAKILMGSLQGSHILSRLGSLTCSAQSSLFSIFSLEFPCFRSLSQKSEISEAGCFAFV